MGLTRGASEQNYISDFFVFKFRSYTSTLKLHRRPSALQESANSLLSSCETQMVVLPNELFVGGDVKFCTWDRGAWNHTEIDEDVVSHAWVSLTGMVTCVFIAWCFFRGPGKILDPHVASDKLYVAFSLRTVIGKRKEKCEAVAQQKTIKVGKRRVFQRRTGN